MLDFFFTVKIEISAIFDLKLIKDRVTISGAAIGQRLFKISACFFIINKKSVLGFPTDGS